MDKTGDYQKCANPDCGHPRYRHDRFVRVDGRTMAQGCLVNWKNPGHKNFKPVCHCQKFVEKS